MQDLVSLFANSQVQNIVVLIAVNTVLGTVAALLKKEFVIGKVANFLKKGFLNYVLTFAVVELVAEALPSLAMLVTVTYWLVVVALVGSILDNLSRFGLPVPKILRK